LSLAVPIDKFNDSTRNRLPLTQFLSVIVPFHNNQGQIGPCCESLLNQTLPRTAYEILFIDNNSTDDSASIVARYPTIQLLREAKPGSYAARNRGIRTAKGEILAFTDADCVVDREWLRRIEAAAREGADVLLGAYSGCRAKFPACALSAYENAKNRYVFASRDETLYYGYTNNMAVRRTMFDKYGLFPEVLRGGDAILIRTLLQAGERRIEYLPEMLVDHLEFQSVRDYYRKVYVHSSSVQRLHGHAVMRPLTNRERTKAFGNMVRAEKYSLPQAALVYLILCVGMFYWIAGRMRPLPQLPGTPDRGK
jgi:glycosyltransferase involved in cell wall biosynthesis